jgi:hypothetical protein
LELNDTALIDEGVNLFCDEYKKLDKDVCRGAAYEYIVMFIFLCFEIFI